jgi:hypothetical protein
MIKAYDVAVKNLIQVFVPNIKVVGLQNDDSGDTPESTLSQAGADSKEYKISYPIISVFRNPDIEITDAPQTKRASTARGYSKYSQEKDAVVSLVAMRTTLTYTVDVFDVTRAAAEAIAVKLFFRLRNNPEISTEFSFEDFNYKVTCKADIQLENQITNGRVNDREKAQCYKIRFSFRLVNANIFDILDKDPIRHINYNISVRLNDTNNQNTYNYPESPEIIIPEKQVGPKPISTWIDPVIQGKVVKIYQVYTSLGNKENLDID